MTAVDFLPESSETRNSNSRVHRSIGSRREMSAMPISKKFLQAVSEDEALKAEVARASYEALGELLKEKGLEDEAAQVLAAAAEKVAEAHGFELADDDAIDIDDLEDVSGGTRLITCISPEVFSSVLQTQQIID